VTRALSKFGRGGSLWQNRPALTFEVGGCIGFAKERFSDSGSALVPFQSSLPGFWVS